MFVRVENKYEAGLKKSRVFPKDHDLEKIYIFVIFLKFKTK